MDKVKGLFWTEALAAIRTSAKKLIFSLVDIRLIALGPTIRGLHISN